MPRVSSIFGWVQLWLPRALGKLSLFCFTTGRQLVIGCNSTDYALWITIESNNNPGLIMLMKPSFTSSNMIDSSGRWGRISSEPRKTFSKYLGHCVHYGWIYVPHLGCNDTAFSTWFYFHTFWVYTSNKLPHGFWVMTLFQNLQHLEKHVARVIYLENLFERCTLWCFRQWHSQDTSRTSALIGLTPWLLRCEPRFSPNIPPANHLRNDSGGFLRPVKTEGFFIQSSWNLTIISRLGSEW